MKLLSGVLFLKSLCAPFCTALDPKAGPACSGAKLDIPETSLALVQISSNCIGFGTSRKQEPSLPCRTSRPLSCVSIQDP